MKLSKIGIHGVPRSGTSWVGAIFDSSEKVVYSNQPLFSYKFKSFLTENSSSDDINSFFNSIAISNDDFINQKIEKEKGLFPLFEKESATHVVYKEARYHNIIKNLLEKDVEIKVVGIIRNPKSVISSWYNAPKEFNKEEWDILKEWKNASLKNEERKEEFYGYNKWKEVTNTFLYLKEKYPNRFYLLEYDKLLNKTEETVKDLFRFCCIEYSEQTSKFLSLSQTTDSLDNAYSVYRLNQVDDKWKLNLPVEIAQSIDSDLKGTLLEKFLYE